MLYPWSFLGNCFRRKRKSLKIDANINSRVMECEIEYEPKIRLLVINYRFGKKLCRVVQLPNTDWTFANRIISDFNEELAKEIYKIELLC